MDSVLYKLKFSLAYIMWYQILYINLTSICLISIDIVLTSLTVGNHSYLQYSYDHYVVMIIRPVYVTLLSHLLLFRPVKQKRVFFNFRLCDYHILKMYILFLYKTCKVIIWLHCILSYILSIACNKND